MGADDADKAPRLAAAAMRWWRAECPVRQVEQTWIEKSMAWLGVEFGRSPLLADVVLPTDEYFPGVYTGSRDEVRSIVHQLCVRMGVDSHRVELEHGAADDENLRLSAEVGIHSRSSGAAGHYRMRDGRSIIAIRDDQARRPMALVATIAHELGHVLLLGDGRISPDRADHEPLTDLLTVYFGLGIFGANSSFEYAQESRGRYSYASTSRLGYLTEPMYGYGLAWYAWLRGETDPDWARCLDTNPRAFLKRGLRYLRETR